MDDWICPVGKPERVLPQELGTARNGILGVGRCKLDCTQLRASFATKLERLGGRA